MTSDPRLAAAAWSGFFDYIVRSGPVREASLTARGLTPNDSRALHALDAADGRPLGALARAWGCDPSNVTFIVDRLERLGLCKRLADAADRRVRLVLLTAKGLATRDALQREFRAPPADFAALPEADLKALARILGKLQSGAEKQKGPPAATPRSRVVSRRSSEIELRTAATTTEAAP